MLKTHAKFPGFLALILYMFHVRVDVLLYRDYTANIVDPGQRGPSRELDDQDLHYLLLH